MAYIFHDRFSGNILLDIETTRHIIRYYLLDSGPIYLGGIARLETRTGRPRQNVYYYQFTAYEHSTFYCRQLCHFMDKVQHINRCYAILIRIIFKQTAEVTQVFPTPCRVTGSFMASRISSTIDRKCNHLNLNSESSSTFYR